MSNLRSFLHEAEQRMAADGLLPGALKADGVLHRCGVSGRERGADGAYKVYLDHPASAWWKNWRTGSEGTYCAKAETGMTPAERDAHRERVKAIKAEHKAEQERRYAAAAKLAISIWNRARPVGDNNPYLQRKAVPAIGLRQTEDGRLIVPVLSESGKPQSLQFILPKKTAESTDKFFLKGGRTAGGFFSIPAKDGKKDGPLLIAEGYATGASLHLSTGYAVLIAFNAGNLEAVSCMARRLYPDREIIICADNDCENIKPDGTKCNPGVEAATRAAQSIDAALAVCPAHEGINTDFNDLHQRQSLDAVATAIEAARRATVRLPNGFFIRESGRNPGLFKTEKRGDDFFELRIGPPLKIIGKTADDASDNWGTLIAWTDLAGVEHRWALPDDLLQGQGREYAQMLARGGYSIAPGQAAKFAAFIQGITTKQFVTCVPRIGWHKGAYVMPDVAYGVPADTIVLQSIRHNGMFRMGGTFDGWKEIPSLCAGNSRLMFALCAAFAGPLLRVAGVEGGGFSFEGGSSSGKTTALQVAASVWGGPEHVRSWRVTDNALEGIAALHNDNVLILDEVGQVSAGVLADSAYMLANGQAKGRAGREGNPRRVLTWNLLFLSSGEIGLSDKLAENGMKSRGGQEVRFVGLPVDKSMLTALHGHPDAGAVADRIKVVCAEHHGHAGREFLKWLCLQRDEVSEDIRGHLPALVDMLCPHNATEQVRRVAKRFSLVLSAGLAAIRAGILPPDMEIMAHIQTCFHDWLTARGGVGASEDAAILSAVRLFIEQHGASRFQDVDRPEALCINRVGFRRTIGSETEFIIMPEAFRADVVRGYSERRAARVLADNGWIQSSADGRLTRERRLPGMGKIRAYILTLPEDAESA